MRCLIGVVTLCAIAGCAPTGTVVVAPPKHRPAVSHGALGALDIRLVRVDIERMPLFDALSALSDAVRNVSGEPSLFSWSYSPSVGGTGVGRVTFHGSDVTLREVLDEFCRQTSMIYSDGGWSIQFDNHPPPGFQPEVRRPRKA